eukprot:jgi/Botrbrau1/1575/Bobra.0107s0062.1
MEEDWDWIRDCVPVRVDVRYLNHHVQYVLNCAAHEVYLEKEYMLKMAQWYVRDTKLPEEMVEMIVQDTKKKLAEGRAFVATLPERLAATERLEPISVRILHDDLLLEAKFPLDINSKNRHFVARDLVKAFGWPDTCTGEFKAQLIEQAHQLRKTNPRKGSLSRPDPTAYVDEEEGSTPGASKKGLPPRKRPHPDADHKQLRNTANLGVLRRKEDQAEWEPKMRKLTGQELEEARAEWVANYGKKRDVPHEVPQNQPEPQLPPTEDATGPGKRSRRAPARLASGEALIGSPTLESDRPSEGGAGPTGSPADSADGSRGQAPAHQMYRPEPVRVPGLTRGPSSVPTETTGFQEWQEPSYLQSLGAGAAVSGGRMDSWREGGAGGSSGAAARSAQQSGPGAGRGDGVTQVAGNAAAAAFAAAAAAAGVQGAQMPAPLGSPYGMLGGALGMPGGRPTGLEGLAWSQGRGGTPPSVPEPLRMAMGNGYPLGHMVTGQQGAVLPVYPAVHPMYSHVPPGPLGPGADVLAAAARQHAFREHLWVAQQQQQQQQQQQVAAGVAMVDHPQLLALLKQNSGRHSQ